MAIGPKENTMIGKPTFSAEMDKVHESPAQVWRLSGKMVGGTCCYDFLETVRDNVAKGQIHPILDMRAVKLANSTGVGVLASIFSAARDAGGSLSLVGVNDRVRSVLKIINLWCMVATFDSETEALDQLAEK
jgi:anti-anti-sigma factor